MKHIWQFFVLSFLTQSQINLLLIYDLSNSNAYNLHFSVVCCHASDVRFRGGVREGASVLLFSNNHTFL